MSYLALAKQVLARLEADQRRGDGGTEPPASAPDRALVVQLLGMHLDRFAREGQPLEVRVPGLPTTLWWVPAKADAEALVRQGVSRGRVWTARELLDVLDLSGLTPEQARTIALAKLELDGDVVGVYPRQSSREHTGGTP